MADPAASVQTATPDKVTVKFFFDIRIISKNGSVNNHGGKCDDDH
jgi:hypothetical protein